MPLLFLSYFIPHLLMNCFFQSKNWTIILELILLFGTYSLHLMLFLTLLYHTRYCILGYDTEGKHDIIITVPGGGKQSRSRSDTKGTNYPRRWSIIDIKSR